MSRSEMNIMNANSGVEVIIEDLTGHPTCPHGPTILFRRQQTRYFACSACRNRKDCQFFMLEEDWIRKKSNPKAFDNPSKPNKYSFTIPKEDLLLSEKTLKKVKKAPQLDRAYCHTCSVLFRVSKDSKNHFRHDIKANLDFSLLSYPSRILQPLENDKKEAQYLFSSKSLSTMIEVLTYNKLNNVICMGTPSIHEHIQTNCREDGMNSLLLDIDSRHGAFYPTDKFSQYNIFNNYFFNGEQAKSNFMDFLQQNNGKNLCLIMDPPFGGRIEPLAQTLDEVTKLHSEINNLKVSEENMGMLPIILVFPYFMEPQIKNHAPYLKMCDYQVTYFNHLIFKDKKVSIHGSPVRLFTNIPLQNFKLPTEDGYTFCKPCLKWIGDWNNHCNKCKSCTSKNGSSYVHCNLCQRCVKPSWEHCDYCNRCCLKEHYCGTIYKEQVCFNCKEIGHKKSDCPKIKPLDSKKRKNEEEIVTPSPGKKRTLPKKEPIDYEKDDRKPPPAKQKRNKKKERKARLKLKRMESSSNVSK